MSGIIPRDLGEASQLLRERCRDFAPADCAGPVADEHPCPYDEELGDGDKRCRCCTICTDDCAYDV